MKFKMKVVAAAAAFFVMLQPANLFTIHAASTSNAEPTVKQIGEQPITSGVVLRNYVFKSQRGGEAVSVNGNVIRIDLQNPYVKLGVMTGVDGQFTTKQSVKSMANETGAVAGVNGDYFNVQAEGAPLGPELNDGNLLSSPSFLKGLYTFAVDKNNQPIIEPFSFTGSVTAASGASFPLSGINKTYYYTEPDKAHSHAGTIQMYTSAWGQVDRGNDGATTPTEVLVQNGVVQQIAVNSVLQMTPPENGYILRASRKAADFINTNIKIGDKLAVNYQLISLKTNKAYDPEQFKMMIGGHTVLIDGGMPAAFSRDVSSIGGYRSRTGLGYSKDGRFAYVITVDKTEYSDGMSLKEFQKFMMMVGVWKGMNLDGGGSTQMVARPLGDFETQITGGLENGTARQVVNGLGVYSTAPQGAMRGMILQGNKLLFIKEQASFQLKAYDQYFNPMHIDPTTIHWASSEPIGAFQSNVFVPSQAGTTAIRAASGQAKQDIEVEVIGKEQLSSLQFKPTDGLLSEGETYHLAVVATTNEGQTRTVPAESLQWEWFGFDGNIAENQLTVNHLKNKPVGQIIARYDGFSSLLTIPAGVDKVWADFDQLAHPVAFEGYPSTVRGSVLQESSMPDTNLNNKALYINYDFSEGTASKAAYASFGAKGVGVEGQPLQMKLRVYGDNSLNSVRAEVLDREGELQRIDIVDHLNWTGWKEIVVDLREYEFIAPISLKRIYVLNPAEGQDERLPVGRIGIDDIRFQYKGEALEAAKVKVKMAVDRDSIMVNDIEQKLDQAPMIYKDTTLIPVRFFVDAMGGTVRWNPQEKRVTILRDHHLLEMWIDHSEAILDGRRVEVNVPPMIQKGRTMLPLRFISESLGWKVSFENATKSITLE